MRYRQERFIPAAACANAIACSGAGDVVYRIDTAHVIGIGASGSIGPPHAPMPPEHRRMSLSERLCSIRAHFDLSQDAMSEKFCLGVGTWKRLEKEGRAPKGDVLSALAEAGIDLNWLLTGVGQMLRDVPAGPIDEQLLAETLRLVEDWLAAHGRTMTPARKAEVAASIYSMANEDAAAGRPAVDERRVAQILKLVG